MLPSLCNVELDSAFFDMLCSRESLCRVIPPPGTILTDSTENHAPAFSTLHVGLQHYKPCPPASNV